MRLRHNSSQRLDAARQAAARDARRAASPMNWRPQSADDLIGQARDVCTAQVAKARRLRDARNAACKLLLYGPPGVGKTSVAELIAARTHRREARHRELTTGRK